MKEAKQKAKELVAKFYDDVRYAIDQNGDVILNVAKRLAIICVDEIIDVIRAEIGIDDPTIPFWQSVKEHIQKT